MQWSIIFKKIFINMFWLWVMISCKTWAVLSEIGYSKTSFDIYELLRGGGIALHQNWIMREARCLLTDSWWCNDWFEVSFIFSVYQWISTWEIGGHRRDRKFNTSSCLPYCVTQSSSLSAIRTKQVSCRHISVYYT